MPVTPVPYTWQFANESLYNPSYGTNKSSVNYKARGTFNHVLPPPLNTIIGQSFPLVSITAKPNGTATGSISW